MADLNPKTTLKDSTTLEISLSNLSDQHTASRIFPGSKNCKWWFTYLPAEDAFSDQIHLSLNFFPAVEGRVTVKAAGLLAQTFEFEECHFFDWFFLDHNNFSSGFHDTLVLRCTVEVDVDSDLLLDENSAEASSSKVISDSLSVDETPLSLVPGLQSLVLMDTLQVFKTFKDTKIIDLRRENDKIEWYRMPTFRYLIDGSNKYRWTIKYVGDDKYRGPVKLSVALNQDEDISLHAKLIVEVNGFRTMTYDIPKCGRFDFEHLSYHDVYETINRREHLEIKFRLELTTSRDFAPIRSEFHDYNEIPTDFKIHCGDDHYEVHKDVLSKISPVFKVMLEHDFIETSSSKLEINDFDFATVEAVMNLCYGRPFDCISVGLTIDVLYFASKYLMADIIVDIEPVLVDNISITNFCAVLHYANNCERTNLFKRCADFFKNNEDAIKTTGTFLALPDSLVIKLLKTAFELKTEFDVFHCARQKGICIDVIIDPSTVKVRTLTDFLKVVPYAWKYHTEGLKLKCAQFYQQNKAEIEKSWEYQSYPKPMQQSLNIIGRRLEVRTDFRKYKDIPTDFAIQCGDNQFKVHKDVLSKISPVFEAMLRHNFVETSSNKIEINDFDAKTVERALNYCYGRPCGDLTTELVLDILYFADKYHIADIFTQLEEVPLHNLSTTNFCAVLIYANDCERTDLFAGCVKFYKQNKNNIKRAVAALHVSLVIELMKSAYQLETELDAFLHARTDGIRLDIEELEVPTLADFFKTVPYAWEKYEDGLKMKCAKFWQDNKDAIKESAEFLSFSRSIKEELDVLGTCFE